MTEDTACQISKLKDKPLIFTRRLSCGKTVENTQDRPICGQNVCYITEYAFNPSSYKKGSSLWQLRRYTT